MKLLGLCLTLTVILLVKIAPVIAAPPEVFHRLKEIRYDDYVRPKTPHFRLSSQVSPEQRDGLVELGRNLFFDPRLSKSGLMSCATCHNPALHWTDGLSASVENVSLRTMSLYDIGWDNRYTWSGRYGSMVAQAFLPLTAIMGMNGTEDLLRERLGGVKYYREAFNKLTAGLAERDGKMGFVDVAIALEFFQSTIVSPRAPFDDWIDGDAKALSPEAQNGFEIFVTKANCVKCHSGWRFTDSGLYDVGLRMSPIFENKRDTFKPFFKAVGLRNIAERPPFMHDGSFKRRARSAKE